MLDYDILRLLCWGLLGLFTVGFALSSGLEMGVALLLPFLQLSEPQRRQIAARMAPLSAGNQAWLAAVIAVLYAGWPTVYAVVFSSFQNLLLCVILAVCIRPIGLYFRNSLEHPDWLPYWDKALFLSGLLPVVVLGLLAGNLLKGFPFHLSSDMHIAFLGSLAGLFNPFAMLVAACCLALLAAYAAVYLQLHGDPALQLRAKAVAQTTVILFLLLFALCGGWITHLEGYHVTTEILPDGVSNPLAKFVKRGDGLWLDNYEHEPALWVIPGLAFLAGIGAWVLCKFDRAYWALLAVAVALALAVLTLGVSMFPFLAPSNISLNSSLTLWDASASQTALTGLLGFAGPALLVMAVATRGLFRILR
ncbi:cytochrome d ubiquinol oxidase subunit II [Methylomonas sp. HW2-6]|uniref:cytochrome d ubiquinol oxidase subunit II n=1 Tax=Methylomonas sp. HW2-6 TaxID=3376687 RepID=UPI0040418DA5